MKSPGYLVSSSDLVTSIFSLSSRQILKSAHTHTHPFYFFPPRCCFPLAFLAWIVKSPLTSWRESVGDWGTPLKPPFFGILPPKLQPVSLNLWFLSPQSCEIFFFFSPAWTLFPHIAGKKPAGVKPAKCGAHRLFFPSYNGCSFFFPKLLWLYSNASKQLYFISRSALIIVTAVKLV